MDDLIHLVLETYFSEEAQEEIRRSFDLFDHFEYSKVYADLGTLACLHGQESSDSIVDRFNALVKEGLDDVLKEHTIVLIPEATIKDRNEICLALAHIQDLQDYTGIIRILESFQSDDIQLARILADMSMYDESRILELIQSFESKVLEILKSYIYEKEKAQPQKDDYIARSVRDNFLLFTKLFGNATTGSKMLESSVVMGERMATYLTFFQDDLVSQSDEETALNILSVIYYSCDGYNSPLLLYRKYSNYILQDLVRVTRVENNVMALISKFLEFIKAEDEKARLLQARPDA